jgi:hypothetical protein
VDNLRASLEKVLSTTHGSIVRRDNNPAWMIPSDDLHELQSILTQWKIVSPNSSNKPAYLAYPLDTPIDGKKFIAPEPEDLVWCDKPLILQIEKVCKSVRFSVFLAKFERRLMPWGERDDSEEDDPDPGYQNHYKLGPPCDTAGKLLCRAHIRSSLGEVTRLDPFSRWDHGNEPACIAALLLVPDIRAFLDCLLMESKNIEPLISYYEALERESPENQEPSKLLEHICSTVIERHHDHGGKHYRQRYYDSEKDSTLVSALNVCMNVGNERLFQKGLQLLPGASIKAYAKLLYWTPRVPFPKIVEGYVLDL